MNETKKQVTQNPGRDDVHEQREPEQPREGVVEKSQTPTEDRPDETKKPAPAGPER